MHVENDEKMQRQRQAAREIVGEQKIEQIERQLGQGLGGRRRPAATRGDPRERLPDRREIVEDRLGRGRERDQLGLVQAALDGRGGRGG